MAFAVYSQSGGIGLKRIGAGDIGHLIAGWAAGNGPLHRQLSSALAAAIERGEVGGGVHLPPERVLADRLAVSRTTVTRAYRHLRDAGLVNARQGRGTVVLGVDRREAFTEFTGEIYSGVLSDHADTIDLTSACQVAVPALRSLLAASPGLELAVIGHGYRPGGLPVLRQSIARHLSGRGLPSNADQIVVTTGAQQAIGLVTSILGTPGASVVTEAFTFPGALDVFRAAHLEPVGVTMDAEGVRPADLEVALVRHRPAFVFLTPSFNNPTGVELSRRRRSKIVEIAADMSIPVVEDNTLELLAYGRSAGPSLGAMSTNMGVLTIGSLSKSVWGGLRVGWVRAEGPVAERLTRAKAVTDIGSPLLNQFLAVPVVDAVEELAGEMVRRVVTSHEAAVDAFAERLPGWDCPLPRGGLCSWVRAPRVDTDELAQIGQRHGVMITPGSIFSPAGTPNDRFRLPLIHAPATMRRAVERIALATRHLEPTPRSPKTRSKS